MSQATELTIKTAMTTTIITFGSRTMGAALGCAIKDGDDQAEVWYKGYAAVQRMSNIVHLEYPSLLGVLYDMMRTDFDEYLECAGEEYASDMVQLGVTVTR